MLATLFIGGNGIYAPYSLTNPTKLANDLKTTNTEFNILIV